MSAIRRDLIERKLWIVAAILLLLVVAVPFVLLKSGSAAGAPPAPAPPAAASVEAVASTATGHGTAKSTQRAAWSNTKRDPFTGSGASASSSSTTTTATTASAPSTPAASSGSSGSGSSATVAAMVTPSPAAGSASAGASSATGSSASAQASATSSHASSSAPVSTTASVTKAPAPKAQSWTTYSVSVRFGKTSSVPLRADIARLTPLPSSRQPLVMFMGMLSNGRQAVFALGPGVQHTGPGWCRPSHAQCAAVLLKAGQTEHLTVSAASGAGSAGAAPAPSQQLVLRVVRIRTSITHSHKTALAAYQRYSAVGQCELDLANPVSYSQTTGTLSTVATAACHGHPRAVPFSYSVTAP